MRRPSFALLLLATLGCGNSSASPPAGEPAPGAVPTAATPGTNADAEVAPAPIASATAGTTDDACTNAALGLPRDAVVATVDGEPIRAEAMGDDGRDAERDALHAYCREVHRIRTATTRRAVEDHLLARAARAKGVTTEELIRGHVEQAATRPDDAEIEAFYAANRTEQAPPLELVRGQVEEAIMKERSQVAYDALLTDLRKGTEVVTKLPDVRPPAQDIGVAAHTATFGPSDAKLQIVEFSDFECPYCSQAALAVKTVKQRFGDKVQFSYRHFPLSFHPAARPAAELTQCALEQGKFWELHDEIFANQRSLSVEGLRGLAQNAGLDMAKVDECLMSGRAAKQVEEDLAKGQAVGVRGTPAFYVGGRAFDGNPDELVAAIEDELRGS